jgi:hypothetical protein
MEGSFRGSHKTNWQIAWGSLAYSCKPWLRIRVKKYDLEVVRENINSYFEKVNILLIIRPIITF